MSYNPYDVYDCARRIEGLEKENQVLKIRIRKLERENEFFQRNIKKNKKS